MSQPLHSGAGLAISEAEVHAAVASVDDPEYPGISIVDLGLLQSLAIEADASDGCRVSIGLVPTFSGCPALSIIADDVSVAVSALPGVGQVTVEWLSSPVWSPERVSHDARVILAESFTVAVQIGSGSGSSVSGVESADCPRCGGETVERSMFGPSRCRSVHRCTACGETVEVLRA